ncbi:hypothetical protein [Glycomyces dulcitolivorans]|uniref:hypothetical protein n=1 Tax=Glycomyces dulcitolivorans TaxID=2200759 RepID=UPI0013006AB8|nr:hypothetical protein [Glycomyces dulcitolivorans]
MTRDERRHHEIDRAATAIVAALPQAEIDDWTAWGAALQRQPAEREPGPQAR